MFIIPFLIYIVLGAAAGFLAGLFGVGGGLIIVPSLYYTLSYLYPEAQNLMQICVGTALATMIVTGSSSARAHHRRGAVRFDLLLALGPGTVIGAALAAYIADIMSSDDLKLFFAVMIVGLATMMVVGPERVKGAGRAWPHKLVSNFCGAVIGLVSGLMGIGGAVLSVPYMSYYKTEMKQAVGTAATLGLFIAFPAAGSFMIAGANEHSGLPNLIGYIYWPAWLAIISSAMFTAPYGAHIAHGLDSVKLRKIFACFMVVLAVSMMADEIF